MNTLYLECASGISGDMFAAAMLDLGANEAGLRAVLQSLGLEELEFRIARTAKNGISATDFTVINRHEEEHACHHHDHAHEHGHEHGHHHDHEHYHEHRNLAQITEILKRSSLSARALKLAEKIFRFVAEAEAKVHGRPVEEVLVFTHPEYRRHGRGTKLFRRYLEDLEEFSRRHVLQERPADVPGEQIGDATKKHIGDASDASFPVIRFSAYPSEVTAAFLTKLGAVHDHDEVLMYRHLGTNNGKELEELEFQMENGYSECSIKTYGTVGYIYGVRTDTGHLREGSAERLLHDVFTKLCELGAEDAVLEVSSANIPAYHLYQKLQFEVRESLQIWNLL